MELKKVCLVFSAMAVIYCEFLADLVATMNCSFPEIKPTKKTPNTEIVKAMILADTHLLGPVRGHWLDKFYREWHMKSAFQAALGILRPDVVFILGDLFDEGDIVNHSQFNEYVKRFHGHFKTPAGLSIISAVGNHDVGFHYKMHPFFTERFERHFNNTGVNLYSIKNNHFVFINSMAMENDGCYFCHSALKELDKLSELLRCLSPKKNCRDNSNLPKKNTKYSRPILMQHFPTYRVSDKVCLETDNESFEKYRENWEVLSKSSTDLLGKLLKPRLSFAGHSHHYCHNKNRWGIDEYTVSSFNWRNKINPSFLLATISPTSFKVSKCEMVKQSFIYSLYYATVLTCFLLLLYHFYVKVKKLRKIRNGMKERLYNPPSIFAQRN